MKYYCLYLLVLIGMSSFGQHVKTQKEILALPNTDLEKDFNLKTGNGNSVPEIVSTSTFTDNGFAYVGHSFRYLKDNYSIEVNKFKQRKLVESTTKYNYGNFMTPKEFAFYYSFSTNGNLKQRLSRASGSEFVDKSLYTYNSDNSILKVEESGTYTDGVKYNKVLNYKYDGNTISYNFDNGTKTYDIENDLITKATTFNKSENRDYIYSYKYDKQGLLIETNRNSSITSYVLNEHNLIAKQKEDYFTKTFKYEYDKYGNWIIAYPLAVYNKRLYGTSFTFYLREIKYSNGDITGSIDPEHSATRSQILNFRNDLYRELVEDRATFTKYEGGKFSFEINDVNESQNISNSYMNKDLLVFHNKTKQLFIIEDFENREQKKKFDAIKPSIDVSHGYYFKSKENAMHIFSKDGKSIKQVEFSKYAPNGIDLIFKETDVPNPMVLKNFKNAEEFVVLPVILYSDYTVGQSIADNSAKMSVNKSPEKAPEKINATFKRSPDGGSFWLYLNGQVSQNLKPFWMHNDLVVFNTNNNKTYQLQDYKNSELDIELPAVELDNSTYTFWFRLPENKFRVYHQGVVYEMGKNAWSATNENDLIIYDKAGFKKYLLKDYKNTPIHQVNAATPLNYKTLTTEEKNYPLGCTGNCADGFGVYKFDTGSIYKGDFYNNTYHGNGTFKYNNGSVYVGQWTNGTSTGKGTYTFGEFTDYYKDVYIGNYVNGNRHGYGKYTFSNGMTYKGQWKDGSYNGKGVHTWPEGLKHVGYYKNGKREGPGTEYYGNGRIKQNGIWENDYFKTANEQKPLTEKELLIEFN